MSNINNNDASFGQNLDLAKVYGLDNNNTQQDLEDLTGYDFSQSQSTRNMQEDNLRTNNNNMGRTSNREMAMAANDMPQMSNNVTNRNTGSSGLNESESMQQDMIDLQDNFSENNMQRTNPSNQSTPKRQEQTLPLSRGMASNNMNVFSQGTQVQLQSTGTMNSFLQTQIGKNVNVQFLIGTNTLVEKSGILLGVGSNYVILRENGSDDVLVCDFDNIKFIRFGENNR